MPARPILPLLLVAASVLAPLPAAAQGEGEAGGEAAACEGLDATEADGRAQIARRIAAIDAAAEEGDVAAFCAASADLAFVYRAMEAAARSCSASRARPWRDALAQTQDALRGTCD